MPQQGSPMSLIDRLYERHCHGDDLCGEAQREIERLQRLIKSTEKWRLQTAEDCERAREERDHYRNEYYKLREVSDERLARADRSAD